MNHEEIQAAVEAADTTWVAAAPGEGMSADELRARCGYVPDPVRLAELRRRPPADLAAIAAGYAMGARGLTRNGGEPSASTTFILAGHRLASARSAAVDWRDHHGHHAVTPVKDQGGCGSCVAFGVTAVIESMVRLEHGITVDLSEADLYFGGGRRCADGWQPDDALNRVADHGEPLEHEFPYVDHDTPFTAVPDRDLMSVGITSHHAINDIDDRKSYLDAIGPMVACFDVYEDFGRYSSGVYRHVTGNKVGGHCVQVIGYDDDAQCWICKNSWGTGWGDQGFFRIAYGECNIDATGFLGIGANPFYAAGGTKFGAELVSRDFVGDFDGVGLSRILRYVPAERDWELFRFDMGRLTFADVGNTSGFGELGDGRPIWTGAFTGSGRSEVLFYYPGDSNWWLGRNTGTAIQWSLAGNTSGFGQVWDGRPFWTGDFSGSGRTEVMFYFPGDGNWWLGRHDGRQLQWSFAGNTSGFGQVWDGRPFWTGDFTASGRTEVMFYFPGDGNWWLGRHDGIQLQWSLAGNTSGAAQPDPPFPAQCNDLAGEAAETQARIDDIRDQLAEGDLPPAARRTLMTRLRSLESQLRQQQSQVDACVAQYGQPRPEPWPNFGNLDDGRPIWTGNFTGSGRAEVLFYFPGDQNWWLGHHDGSRLRWSFAGNTAGFGQVWDGRPFWTGDFTAAGRAEVLFYFPGDGNWWLGRHDGAELQWTLGGNTSGLGQLWDGRPFWTGDFCGARRTQLLSFFPRDGEWWVATHGGDQFQWSTVGSTLLAPVLD